jgi:hypothetical protein
MKHSVLLHNIFVFIWLNDKEWIYLSCLVMELSPGGEMTETLHQNFLKRDNSVKNRRKRAKFDLDLCIPLAYLHMQFQPYTYMLTKVRERKLKISTRGITPSKIIWPWPNSKLTCVFLWRTHAISTLYIHPYKG